MKPRFKTTVGSKRDRETMAAAAQRTSTLALSSEISMSFQDELAATIHGAFEVAVEIAVREVSKLVGQALGDVRDQMHETLKENKSLKVRLQSAEKELDAARLCAAEDSQTQLSLIHSDQRNSPLNTDRLKSEKHTRDDEDQAKTALNVTVKKTCDYLIVEAEASCERLDGNVTFSEICEDGRVCSQTLNATPSEDIGPTSSSMGKDVRQHPQASNEDKADLHNDESNLQQETVSYELSTEIKVKEEKPDLDLESGSGSVSVSDSQLGFDHVSEGADSFSLAQSKMLEDWRPDPLNLPGCETDSLIQSSSHALAHPMAVTMQPAEMSTSSVGSLPAFPNIYQPNDTVPLPHVVPQNYSAPARPNLPTMPPSYKQHVCKICSRPFQRPSDLRRHQSQHHRSKPANSAMPRAGGRPPKQQKFPPGRSPYHCSECGRDFNRLENLKTHLRIHTGERPYACSVCGVRFRHSGALTRHFRIHTGEKPYVCGQCGMSFRNSGGLRFHQRLHNRQTQTVMGQ